MKMTINFDMDGTIANLYGVENWLDYLIASDPTPYLEAKPLLNLSVLARRLNALQKNGKQLGVISWTSRGGSPEYNTAVVEAKKEWLKKHLPSVKWDKINIVPYGTPKQNFCSDPNDILFDDETPNLEKWTGKAYRENEIMEILKTL